MQEQDQPIHRILDDKKRADIIGLMTLGCSRRKAAQCVGCVPSTITRLIQRDSDFAAQVARAEQNIETLALANIRAACKQERYWRASAWVLKHRNPEDFATRSPDVMTTDQLNQFLTQFTEVILRELPPDLWYRITTAIGDFMMAAQQEIRVSLPCQAQDASPDSPTQQSCDEIRAPNQAPTVEPPLPAEDQQPAPTERKLAPAGGPAALAPAYEQT